MLDKVRAAVTEYQNTEQSMQDPVVYGDPKKVTELSRKLKRLKPLVDVFAEYQGCERALADAEAAKGDPELAELAAEEAARAQQRMPQLHEHMRRLLIPKDPDD